MTTLLKLSLCQNKLSGTIPAELEKLNDLQLLDLSGNQLSGAIPPELGNLTSLSDFLDLSDNQIKAATIPSEAWKNGFLAAT